jgi:hypothetical protein
MNNLDIKRTLKDCRLELQDIKSILDEHSTKFSRLTKYLTNYAIIRACSTIEFCYKNLIADFFEHGQSKYIKNFISMSIRRDSSNPSLAIINKTLKSFDIHYNDKFNKRIKKDRKIYEESLNKLRDARNTIAHGGTITITVNRVIEYFEDSRKIIISLDSILESSNVETLFRFLFGD